MLKPNAPARLRHGGIGELEGDVFGLIRGAEIEEGELVRQGTEGGSE